MLIDSDTLATIAEEKAKAYIETMEAEDRLASRLVANPEGPVLDWLRDELSGAVARRLQAARGWRGAIKAWEEVEPAGAQRLREWVAGRIGRLAQQRREAPCASVR
jgi:hypothetical protein